MHVLDKMHLLKWTAVFLTLHNLLSTVDGSLRKRVNFQPVVMSSDDVVRYFKSFIGKTSSFAKANEAFYTDDYAEDLYHKIDNLISAQTYMRYLMKTKDITDQTNSKGGSLLAQYQSTLNAPCNPLTIYNQSLDTILRSWDGDKSQMTNMLEDWHMKNHKMPPTEQCNRFKGLTCQYKRALEPDLDQGKSSEISNSTTCQCAQDPANVGFYKSLRRKKEYSELSYPDGCYVRPWRPCRFPSIDPIFKRNYQTWHGDVENEKRLLAQMAWPIARVHRCKEDTLCLDMIPGMGKPICWCNPNSLDKACNKAAKNAKFTVPLGTTFLNIRKQFAQTIIPANDTNSFCHPEHNPKVLLLMKYAGKDPSRTGAMDIMEQLGDPKIKARLCDFRKKILCDQQSRTCKGTLDCDEGKIHVGQGVCAVNNGYPCQTNEECVPNAKCKHFNGLLDSACVCQTGYGDQCLLQNPAFFGHKFLPIISGFQEQKFVDLQTEIHATLESWEDTMTLDEGSICDPSEDKKAMELVKWFGSLEEYNKTKGSDMLKSAHQITRDISKSCRYKRFQRCDSMTARCVPMHGKKVLSTTVDVSGDMKILVEVEPKTECIMEMPKVYNSIVNFVCPRGYFCKRIREGGYCLPDCDSVFAPKKECPETQTAPVVVTENSGLGDADPDAQLSIGEDGTTVSEVLVPDDRQQNNMIDEIDLGVPPTDSLDSISVPEKADMSNLVMKPEPDNSNNNDLDESSNTQKEFEGDNQIVQAEDTNNDVGEKLQQEETKVEGQEGIQTGGQLQIEIVAPDGAQTDGQEATQAEGQEEIQTGGQEETQTEAQKETQTEGQEDTKNNDPGEESQTEGQEGGGNDVKNRLNPNCSPNEIVDPGDSTSCKPCPANTEPDNTASPPIACICKKGYYISFADVCERCPLPGQIPDPADMNQCIYCENPVGVPDPSEDPPFNCIPCEGDNKIPDPADRSTCKECGAEQVASTDDRSKCVCADPIKVPDSSDVCIECPNGKEPDKGSTSIPPCKCKLGFTPKPSSDECEAAGSVTTNTVCEPGSVPDPVDTSVCKPCPDGQIPDLAATPPICTACRADQVVSPNRTKCICPAATIFNTTQNLCTACGHALEEPNLEQTKCICKNGTVIGNPSVDPPCVTCPAGKGPNVNQTMCICLPGTVTDVINPDDCMPCPDGKEPNLNRTICICKSGTVPNDTNPDLCMTCPDGKEPNLDRTICICKSGTVPNPDVNNTCMACPNGKVPDASGLTCVCPSDQMPNTDGTTCICLDGTDPINNMCNNGSTTTTPSPGPPPNPPPAPITPAPLPHGSTCSHDGQCANPFVCRDKTCQCLVGLRNFDKNKCGIPLDHRCDAHAKKGLQMSNPGYNTKNVGCSFGAACTKINGKEFCRVVEERGYMIMSEQHFRKVKNNGGSAFKSGLDWKQHGGLAITLTLAVLNNIEVAFH